MFELAQGLRDSKTSQSELLLPWSFHTKSCKFLRLAHDPSQNLIKICEDVTINKIRESQANILYGLGEMALQMSLSD